MNIASDNAPNRRKRKAWVLGGIVLFALSGIGMHLVNLAEVAPPPKPKFPVPPERAAILDRQGHPLAETTYRLTLWMDPSRFLAPCDETRCVVGPDHALRIARLITALGIDPVAQKRVKAQLAQGNHFDSRSRFVHLAYNIAPDVAEKLDVLRLPGIGWHRAPQRHYPQGTLFAHAVGFTMRSEEIHGLEGLEWVANQRLSEGPTGADGKIEPVRTTLDNTLQRMSHDALTQTIAGAKASGGAIVIVEASTGAVRAMVSAPGFDPNDDANYRLPLREDRIFNHAVANVFPLEGLITPLLVAQALDKKQVNAGTRLGSKGTTVADITRNPNLADTAKLLRHLPAEAQHDYLHRLGFGHALGMPGIPKVVDGELNDWRDWTPAMQASLGHHVSANLMQVLQAYQPIAGDGRMNRLHLFAPTDAAACPREASPTQDCTRVVSLETAATLRRLMAVGGSHSSAATLSSIPTGHAQPGIRTIHVGMTAADAPRYLVGVLLHHHSSDKNALMPAATALFNRLMEEIGRPQDRAFAHELDTRPHPVQPTQSRA